ncbi:glycine dehydrogenase (decarboxylating) alpha subunit [Desulfacinum hydrothermale DSM 13146]|uniref:Probable glycine dehydrogenase (decarboxylating) subunit 1 n=1 Tax=Desulfacinum hydrothermale DSM 13146 TaxID=1121390 RepID=A0A1W1XVH6_9BACT|nr:aminomethyl-transferring glycine dehydrogenase subunit GcvPA [Desulfacinum hydrothermale]SMC27887.1 glycine dehydrogenase (decarboxylating) alpha subunit [Desulfacinum hydrothermale DSM 13146]
MRYLPHTPEDVASMLQAVGADSLEELFAGVPETCRRKDAWNLPEPLTEWELNAHMDRLAARVASSPYWKIYLGAGSYEHHIPAAVSYLLGRSEFSTAYTPYQPEISQGTLQGIYEYQTLTARLLGMDVANASMYDGASALAEALLMAFRITRKKKRVAVSRAVSPFYRRVVATYFAPTDYEVVELPLLADGTTDLSGLGAIQDLAAVAVQSPNFFGCLEDLEAAGRAIHETGAVFVACFSEPLAFGIVKSPGAQGADIVCGEGQSFGNPQSFGGPGLGMFATRQDHVRKMPGRLVGRTTDLEGRPGFVLTLSTREQHIRRAKATSNICSNQGLCAMTAAMYMASLGGTGIRELAQLNHDKAEYLKEGLLQAGFSAPLAAPTFNEFVLKAPAGFGQIWKRLQQEKIVAGLPLAPLYPEMEDHYLFCVTETKSRDDLDVLIREVSS